jgi:hypothetical protein
MREEATWPPFPVPAAHPRRMAERAAIPHVLEVVGRDRSGPEFFVVSGFGTRADWLRNLDACGPATVTTGKRTFPADHRRLGDAEAYAVFVDYERHHRWIQPVVHRVLSWLLGWP